MPRIRIVLTVLALSLGTAAAAGAASINLVAYSTPKTVMGKIIQAWQSTPDGNGVSFTQSYGASTDQAKAVAAGLPADVVFLSTYASDGRVSRAAGMDIQYVIPRQTLLIELPIAVLKGSSNRHAAQTFMRFTKSDAAQELFAQNGFRPVNPAILKKYASTYRA